MCPSFRARKRKKEDKERRNCNVGSIATRDASETSVGVTGAAEGVKKGNGGEAEGNERTRKNIAGTSRVTVRSAGSYRLAIKVDGDNNSDIAPSLYGFL